ncbi:Alpha/beta hydrolase family protein [compost metagenome]
MAGLEAIVHKWSPTWTPTHAELEDAKAAFRRPGGTEAVFGYYRGLVSDAWGAVWGPSGLKLGRFPMPTLMVYGEADGAVNVRHFGQSQRYFTGPFQLAPIPGAGHFPQQEAPAAFAKAVTEFLGPAD